jgi:adenosylcobinamide-GDP ribazoletransferase
MGMFTRKKQIPLLLARFCTALRFLTVIPLTWRAEDDSRYFDTCLVFFPVIGALIGTAGAAGIYLTRLFFPEQVVAIIAVVYLGAISGFLHLDGLSDSADGLLSARPRETSLTIMKDSRVGAMGVIAVVLILLAKYCALSSLGPGQLCLAVFFMPLAGRCAILFTMACLPYARPEGGLGRLFYAKHCKATALAAFLSLFMLFAFLAPARLTYALFAILAVNILFGRWCLRRLGGATGDTLGAVCELTEVITALVFTVSISFS